MTSLLTYLTGATSLGLALNIGANNSAAEMGPAYGAGIRSRREATAIIAVFCIAGAIFAGHRVTHTISQGLLGANALAAGASALVVVMSALTLTVLANALRIPIATSHAVVGSVVGLGLYQGTVNYPLVARVVGWWAATPLASLAISYGLGKLAYPRLFRGLAGLGQESAVRRLMAWLVTGSSAWIAFSAGSNSLAKAMGPAVGAGVFTPTAAAVVGGLGMAAGALLLGGRLMKTVGKEITAICPLCAVLVQTVSATIVFTASRFGMPVSLAEVVTCSVIGFAAAANGVRRTADNQHVRRILLLWPAAPAMAATLAFALQLAVR
jgi:phosphate/sulfate permease